MILRFRHFSSGQGTKIEKERIKGIKSWLEPISVKDIQVFLGFANFYKSFIRNSNRVAPLLTSMLWVIDKTAKNKN